MPPSAIPWLVGFVVWTERLARSPAREEAMMKRWSVSAAVLWLLLQAGGPAMAGPILDFTTVGAVAQSASLLTAGWRFTVTSPITVSALGLMDRLADGLVNSHQIGVWSCGVGCSTGGLLASTTITTANSTPVASTSPFGDWRFTPIPSLTLAPGDYVVGATFVVGDPDLLAVQTNAPSTIAGVTFDLARVGFGAGLIFPGVDATALDPGEFGPNLFVGSLAVAAPEPSALLLLGSGLAGLAGLAWRRRQT
jgi:hypothetical protein